MKKLKRFQPALVTEKFFPHTIPAHINTGRCFKWAYIAYRLFEGTELWSMGAHAFIRYRGKFYDSERLNGVSDYKDLPATNYGQGCGCPSCLKPAARKYVPAFKHAWRGAQARFGVDWDKLDLQVIEVIKSI